MYITASSTISHQPTFRNQGFSSGLSELARHSSIRHPDYTPFIPSMSMRRMSEVLRMAIACAVDCLEQSGLEQPEAIIVGTSMGCNKFTKSFLDKIISSNGGLLSPTSFILSTHNTIAGQISLLLGNHTHNMTHTQNSLSFEQALIDGILCLREGRNHVLAGAADEMENELYNIYARLNTPDLNPACGASFFILSTEKTDTTPIYLVDVGSFGLIDDLPRAITAFLNTNGLSPEDIDLLLYSWSTPGTKALLNEMFSPDKSFDYQKIAGAYFTNSAFAMHYGIDRLLQAKSPSTDEKIERILVCNNLIPENLGLVLIDATKG